MVTITTQINQTDKKQKSFNDDEFVEFIKNADLEEGYLVFSLTIDKNGVELNYCYNLEEQEFWLEGFGNETESYVLTPVQEFKVKQKLIAFADEFVKDEVSERQGEIEAEKRFWSGASLEQSTFGAFLNN